MAGAVDISSYSDALVILGTAGVVVPIMRRLGLSAVLGYLAIGAVLGPHMLGSLREGAPWLAWLTVSDTRSLASVAELGVVFLLFLIGLELSLARLVTMRRLVAGLGAIQVLACTTVIALTLMFFGVEAPAATALGACLALSSTAIVIEILSEQGRLGSSAGRASFAVLFAQDLAVMPILLIISVLAASSGGSVLGGVGVALLQALLGVAAIVFLGRVALKPLFRLVANSQSTELFMAATVFVIVATSLLAALSGLSMALGAFVAGLLLAETEYRKVIQTHIEPFKGLLLGVFFFTIGMGLDLPAMLAEPLRIVLGVLALVVAKGLIIFALALAFRVSRPAALETAMLLAPSGEFTLVGIGAALAAGLIQPGEASFTTTITSLSMALIPLMAFSGRRLGKWMSAQTPPDPALLAKPEAKTGHAIVVGHGRVGQVVSAMLRVHNIPYIATDSDARAVSRERKAGHEVFFGDAANLDYLATLGLQEARAVILTIHTAKIIDEIVPAIRSLRPDIPIVSRARDAGHARHLYSIGVTDAVPETIEASLQLSEAALVDLGVPMGLVIASIHEKRDEFRHEIQAAARAAGQEIKPHQRTTKRG